MNIHDIIINIIILVNSMIMSSMDALKMKIFEKTRKGVKKKILKYVLEIYRLDLE